MNIRVLEGMAAELGMDPEVLKSDYSIYEMPLMDGYMSPEEYCDHLRRKFLIDVPYDDLFAKYYTPYVNEKMLGYVDALRAAGHRCVIGSNTCAPHWAISLNWPSSPLSHFDRLYASYLFHLSKPEPAFFRYIVESEGFDCKDVSFTDDRAENAAGAASLGIETLVYSGNDRDEKAERFFSRYLA